MIAFYNQDELDADINDPNSPYISNVLLPEPIITKK
jgi:hypothetical protein